jgi:hypothetical protein
LTTISACPATEWQLFKTNGANTWTGADLVPIDAAGADLIKIDGKTGTSTYDITIDTHNKQATKNNWYNKFILRGFSKAKENPRMPKDIIKDMILLVDVCGNEAINNAPDSGNDLNTVAAKTYKIEKTSTRSHSFTFG